MAVHEGDMLNPLERLGRFLLLVHKGRTERYMEIDALRGIAIVMMVIYHLVYDLAFLGYYRANVLIGGWRLFARTTAILFILLAGVSLALSYARVEPQKKGGRLYSRYLTRGLKLIGWGLVITAFTWVYMGKPVIIFGILHLIGTATLFAFPFLSLRWANLAIGPLIIGLGMYLNQLPVSHPWFLLLGLRPAGLFQFDYFPLLPWFGVVLLGVFIGQTMYPGGVPRLGLMDVGKQPVTRGLIWLGRRSLAIYLVHQPLLFAMLTLVGLVSVPR